MTQFSTYAEFVLDTAKNMFTGPQKRINDAVLLNYKTSGYALRGKRLSRIIQGGQYINDQIELFYNARAQDVALETTTTPQIFNTGVEHSVPWRSMRTYVAWEARSRSLNRGGNPGTEGGFQTLKDMVFADLQDMETDSATKVETDYWQVPNTTTMESASGVAPYSIPCGLNEFANALPSAAHPGGAWTTFQGIGPTTTGWSNYIPLQTSYDNVTVNSPSNLLNALDVTFATNDITPPPTKQMYFEAAKSGSSIGGSCVIFCSPKGMVKLSQIARASQDRWVQSNDAYNGSPTYGGVPVVPIALIGTQALYPTGSAAAIATATLGTESSTANTTVLCSGPRYYVMNMDYYHTIWHNEWYMKASPEMSQFDNWTNRVIWFDTLRNNFMTSRRRQAIVYPSGGNIPL